MEGLKKSKSVISPILCNYLFVANRRGFFFGSREPKALAPIEIAHVVMESNKSLEHKPFIQNLASSVRKTARGGSLSALKRKDGKSITGLFDSPSLTTRYVG